MNCQKLIENIITLRNEEIDKAILRVRFNVDTIINLIKSKYTHINSHIYNWSWIGSMETKWATDVNYSNCTDYEVEVLVFEYIDRGIIDWSWFSTKLRQLYPNLKILIFDQNFSYNEEKCIKRMELQEESFLNFIDSMNLELFLLFDYQTSWLKPYKPDRFAYKSPKWPKNTMIL
jgi:hypothetical protein